jgi:acetyl/propionyl-CoA carboxylase alpha subunit
MKLRADWNGDSCILEIKPNGDGLGYQLSSVETETSELVSLAGSGTANVLEVMPGVYSVIAGHRSTMVRLSPLPGGGVDVVFGGQRLLVNLGDLRDRSPRGKKDFAGPQEIRAHMPGKVVKILVAKGDHVTAGQGVLMIEAMKMQNELKAPKEGLVTRLNAEEGATVAAGETLMVVE